MGLTIHIDNLGKKFVNEWIFRHVSLSILPGEKWVILGSNGSGKSTLLQSLASFLIPTQGSVVWKNNEHIISDDLLYKQLSMASPYMELIEDFTLMELVVHQKNFKPFLNNLSVDDIIRHLYLEEAAHKYIKNYSSGMRQRVKLGLAIMADCPVLFLDEPCSNLDAKAIAWYQQLIETFASQKTILVCSNAVKEEYLFCDHKIEIENYKVKRT